MSLQRTLGSLLTGALTAALAGAWFAAPAAAFTVTAVKTSVTPASYTGTCPTTFTFTAKITADGPGTVTYRWAHFPYVNEERSLVFAAPGTQSETYALTMAAPWPASEGHWLDLIVSSPNFVMDKPTVFELVCRRPIRQQGLRQPTTPKPISVTLKDGTSALVAGDSLILIRGGVRVPAPDGTYELSTGGTIVVSGGKIVQKTAPRAMPPRP